MTGVQTCALPIFKAFNGVAGGDTRDWASGTADSFNAFSGPGVQNDSTAVDVRVVDVLGSHPTAAVPEPATYARALGPWPWQDGVCAPPQAPFGCLIAIAPRKPRSSAGFFPCGSAT